jgi:hypothetical protein
MSAAIGPSDWLGFIERDYLADFIGAGGASIKFVVPLEESEREACTSDLAARAQSLDYVVCRVSAGDTRIHMVDQLYFRVAEQIPWRALCESVLGRLARDAGYPHPALPGEGGFGERLAEANGVDATVIGLEMRRVIAQKILQRHWLLRDFRVAITQLCLAHLMGGPDGESMDVAVEGWLNGENQSISSVKPYSIHNKITRANSRLMFESLLEWVRYAERPGVVIVLDAARLSVARRPDDGLVFYTKAQLLDAYEVLRQFIDGTARLSGCLLVIFPAIEFLDTEPASRGMGAYDALKFRVYDEIHDQRLANPMGALVRLSARGAVQ